MPSITVKWGKEKYDVDVDLAEPPIVLKSQLFALTGVAPERQKVVIKGKTLPDDSWTGIAISNGLMCMMMGSADAIPEAPKPQTVQEAAAAEEAKGPRMPNGLENLGNTCYMNSVLQSFKTIPELESCLKLSTPSASSNAGRVTAGIKQTFDLINSPQSKSVMPLTMLAHLHAAMPQFASRNPRGGYEQQDANECFTEVLRMTLEGLGGAKPEGCTAPIKDFFRGRFSVTMKNTESPDEPEQTSTEDFYQLSCFLSQDVKYIQTGLKEKLTEEIEKNSPTLGRNAKYEKKTLIDRLPAYVSVQMVRFFYKESAQTNAKILKDVKFPLVLDLFDTCTPALKEKVRPHRDAFKADEDAKLERMRQAKLSEATQQEQKMEKDDGVPLPFSFEDDPGSNNSGFYELKAVITHKGRSSDSGHYVAWVRLEGDKWAMCDDDEVHPVTADQVLRLSGGGDWHTAYVLVYGPRICKKYPALTAEATQQAAVEDGVSEPMQS